MGDFTPHSFSMESSPSEDYDAETNSTEPDAVNKCALMKKLTNEMFTLFLIFSVVLTLGLSFIVRRKKLCLNCFWRRPGLLQPVNFIDEVYRRWAYAACFVILTSDMLILVDGKSKLKLLQNKDKEWMNKFGWVNVFVKLLEALAVSLVYYPLLACINHRHSIAANVLGILYLIPWIVMYSSVFHYCPISKEGTFYDSLDYITMIPIYIAYYVVGLSYVLDLVRNIRQRRKLSSEAKHDFKSSGRGKGHLDNSISHHFQYLANLLLPRKPERVELNEKENVVMKKSRQLIKRLKYDKIMGFRYSTRVICCTTIAATLVIWIVLDTSAKINKDFHEVISPCEQLANIEYLSFLKLLCDYIFVAEILIHVSSAVAGLVVLILIINTLVTYKRMWHRLLRGDHSWHMYGTTIETPANTLLNGLKYAGFQVAYAAWGWAVLSIVLWLLLMFLAFAFFIPLKLGQENWFIRFLKRWWPTVVLGFVILWVQRLICRFFFLQDKGESLALDNRRLYNAASYYFLVLNVIIGFISCLKRILIPLILGILFLSRLDQPLIMKGYEAFDPGYVSFVSMLLVDLYHNHPVVKAFVELMLQVRKQQQHLTGVNGVTVTHSEEKRLRSKLIRNRWWKTVTLVNNPSLALGVLEQRLKDIRRNAGQTNQSFTGADVEFSSTEMQCMPKTTTGDPFYRKGSSTENTQASAI